MHLLLVQFEQGSSSPREDVDAARRGDLRVSPSSSSGGFSGLGGLHGFGVGGFPGFGSISGHWGDVNNSINKDVDNGDGGGLGDNDQSCGTCEPATDGGVVDGRGRGDHQVAASDHQLGSDLGRKGGVEDEGGLSGRNDRADDDDDGGNYQSSAEEEECFDAACDGDAERSVASRRRDPFPPVGFGQASAGVRLVEVDLESEEDRRSVSAAAAAPAYAPSPAASVRRGDDPEDRKADNDDDDDDGDGDGGGGRTNRRGVAPPALHRFSCSAALVGMEASSTPGGGSSIPGISRWTLPPEEGSEVRATVAHGSVPYITYVVYIKRL